MLVIPPRLKIILKVGWVDEFSDVLFVLILYSSNHAMVT